MKTNSLTGLKTCSHCRKDKIAGDFHRCKANPDGLHSQCKKCRSNDKNKAKQERIYQRARIIAHPEFLIVSNCRRRAAIKSLPCTITVADIFIPVECPVCNCLLVRGGDKKKRATSPSLDMYNPRLGYIPGNIWIICDRCNSRKQDLSGEDHVIFGWKLIEAFKEEYERVAQLSSSI